MDFAGGEVQSDAKELDTKLVNANPATVGVVHPEPIVALQKTKQTSAGALLEVPKLPSRVDPFGSPRGV